MANLLQKITKQQIQSRCTEPSFERGQRYYAESRVIQRKRTSRGLQATVRGTRGYHVRIRQSGRGLTAFCTCPYAHQWEGDCKHIVATLLAWLEEPESFCSQEDLRLQLSKLTKAELIDRMLEICEIYPEVAEVLVEGEAFDHEAAIGMALSSLDPSGDWDEEKAVAGLELVARRAENCLERGDCDQARRIYHALIVGCLKIDEEYGSTEIFPDGLVYSFAQGYHEAVEADPEREQKAAVILEEIAQMEKSEFAEIEGVDFDEVRELLKRSRVRIDPRKSKEAES